ncbi:MAG: glycosyl transferase, family 2 [Bacteriovoracaceae bacterium]|nr:glycosyl transferase, family 2 [Bacteriovoracaceae bacterium]
MEKNWSLREEVDLIESDSRLTKVPTIIAVVPIHNGLPAVLNCVQSIYDQKSSSYRLIVIVVDDGSTDASISELKKQFSDVHIIQGDGSLWWTGAIDKGSRVALELGADYVFWINHDDILEPHSLERLLNVASKEKHIIACSVVIKANDPTFALCGYSLRYMRWYIQPLLVSQKEARMEKFRKFCDLNGGHGILIPKSLFNRPHMLRPHLFPHYAGDFDFYFQARRSGFKALMVGGAVIRNEASSSGLLSGFRIQEMSQIIPYLTSPRSLGNLRDRPLLALLNFPLGLNFIWAFLLILAPLGSVLFFPFRKNRNSL